MKPYQIVLLILLNIPLFFIAWKAMFKDWDDFWECLRFWITPDIISAFRGEYWDDTWSEFRLFLWLFGCFAFLVIEFKYFF